jgi:hypothetical protein
VQCARIEIRSVRPDKRSGLRIHNDAIEHSKVLKRTEQRAVEHRPKVDVLSAAVVEAHDELVRPNHFETGDADD